MYAIALQIQDGGGFFNQSGASARTKRAAAKPGGGCGGGDGGSDGSADGGANGGGGGGGRVGEKCNMDR